MTTNEAYAADRRRHIESLAKKIEAGTLDNKFDNLEVQNILGKQCNGGVLRLAILGSISHARLLHDTILPEWSWSTKYAPESKTGWVNVWEIDFLFLGKRRYRSHSSAMSGNVAAAWVAAIVRAKGSLP